MTGRHPFFWAIIPLVWVPLILLTLIFSLFIFLSSCVYSTTVSYLLLPLYSLHYPPDTSSFLHLIWEKCPKKMDSSDDGVCLFDFYYWGKLEIEETERTRGYASLVSTFLTYRPLLLFIIIIFWFYLYLFFCLPRLFVFFLLYYKDDIWSGATDHNEPWDVCDRDNGSWEW